jgi:hypothetical protein
MEDLFEAPQGRRGWGNRLQQIRCGNDSKKAKAVRALHECSPHLKIEMWGTQHSARYSRLPLGMTARKATAKAGLLRERLKVRFTFSGLCHFLTENPIQ